MENRASKHRSENSNNQTVPNQDIANKSSNSESNEEKNTNPPNTIENQKNNTDDQIQNFNIQINDENLVEVDKIIDQQAIDNNVILTRKRDIQILRVIFQDIRSQSNTNRHLNDDFEIYSFRVRIRTIVGNSCQRLKRLLGDVITQQCEKDNYCLRTDDSDMQIELSDLLFELKDIKSNSQKYEILRKFKEVQNQFFR